MIRLSAFARSSAVPGRLRIRVLPEPGQLQPARRLSWSALAEVLLDQITMPIPNILEHEQHRLVHPVFEHFPNGRIDFPNGHIAEIRNERSHVRIVSFAGETPAIVLPEHNRHLGPLSGPQVFAVVIALRNFPASVRQRPPDRSDDFLRLPILSRLPDDQCRLHERRTVNQLLRIEF